MLAALLLLLPAVASASPDAGASSAALAVDGGLGSDAGAVLATEVLPDAGVERRVETVRADAGDAVTAPALLADAGLPSAAEVLARGQGRAVQEKSAEGESELDELAALEAATIDPRTRADATLRQAVARLGYGSMVRDGLEERLDEADASGEELPLVLAPVTDVESFDVSQVKATYDIPVEMQPLVVQYIHFFQGPGRKWFRKWMSRSARYIPLMQPLLEERGLPRDLVYLSMIESGFNTQAKSWARAVGPWQFIAGTAKLFKLKDDFWIDERRDPIKSTIAAAEYLGLLYQTLGHWYLAWAGYNTGGGRVRWMIDKYGTRDWWELSEKKGFARETKHYVPKLIACALVARYPDAFGFTKEEFEFEGPFEYDEVPLTDAVDLEVLATAAGTSVDELRELNPEIKRWCTPPATEKEPYLFRIPKGKKEAFDEAFAKLAPTERLHLAVHRVAKGDTLSKIAATYHSAQEAILRMNGLPSAKSLRLGADLVVPVPSAQALKTGKVDVALERQVARARKSGLKASRPEDEVPVGAGATPVKVMTGGTVTTEKVEGKTRVTYGVARGDSLWTIARRFDVRVADLREWNESLGQSGSLKVGSSLVLWPGEKADLAGAKAPEKKPAEKKPAEKPKAPPAAPKPAAPARKR